MQQAAVQLQEPVTEDDAASQPPVIRAKILNRNIAVITSHRLCADVLRASDGEPQDTLTAAVDGESIGPDTFAVQSAYHELMSDFFPPPNLLLLDGSKHQIARAAWDEQLSSFPADVKSVIQKTVNQHIQSCSEETAIDLYEFMKELSWKVLLGIFLELEPTDKTYSKVESLQETLLRGQFSLFPVSVNTPFWRSPRSKGIDARQQLQRLLQQRMSSQDSCCPFLKKGKIDKQEVASNVLLFTSSIAVKALASLLTASLLNLFLLPGDESLASRIRAAGPNNGSILLNSILSETERLSPPVVGIMRRAQNSIIVDSPNGQPATLIPSGWDVWLYFVGAGRDKTEYKLADKFLPERFIASDSVKPGFTFGAGQKSCLGRHVVRQIIHVVAETMLEANLMLEGSVNAQGVRGWLGWETDVSPAAFARDLKQLPCQRPKDPIHVRIYRDHDHT